MSRLIPDEVWATLTLLGEARGESFLGKVAVGEVIRTRMARKYLSDGTVSDTVLRAYQFSSWNTTDQNRLAMARADSTHPLYQECARAWAESERTIVTQGATHYLAPAVVAKLPPWYDPTKITFREGGHEFLRL